MGVEEIALPAQWKRRMGQIGFFALFVLAPALNIFRFDLSSGHAWLLGFPWRLGIDDYLAGRIDSVQAGLNVLLRLFAPIVLAAIGFLWVAWRWGRLYCGWLCPHFMAVELINGLMRRANGKPSVWDKQTDAAIQPNGKPRSYHPLWWLPTLLFAFSFAAIWAVVLLTYLLPPATVYAHLFSGALTPHEARFIGVATVVLCVEFLFARHLFCRFGCAVGLFQSLSWMANRRAMVVGFNRANAADCNECQTLGGSGYAACEAECPMRLRPRQTKQKMFACTQCSRCLSACNTVQAQRPLLRWIQGEAAQAQEARVSLTGHRS